MASNEEALEEANGDSSMGVKQRFRDRSKVGIVFLLFDFFWFLLKQALFLVD